MAFCFFELNNAIQRMTTPKGDNVPRRSLAGIYHSVLREWRETCRIKGSAKFPSIHEVPARMRSPDCPAPDILA
ncbi:hypothetical protein AB4Y45_41120 [Paraburkholderia sp. EG287A]|uniref:hypothetical protein n=1 Tax=unclassified Paraburkholderia TaxID=2615204 RepID=UPI0034D35090